MERHCDGRRCRDPKISIKAVTVNSRRHQQRGEVVQKQAKEKVIIESGNGCFIIRALPRLSISSELIGHKQ
jgi:hypothetical protein